MAIRYFIFKIKDGQKRLRLLPKEGGWEPMHPKKVQGLTREEEKKIKSALAQEYGCQAEEVCIIDFFIFDPPLDLAESPIGVALDALPQTIDGAKLLQHLLDEVYRQGVRHGMEC